MFLATPLEVAGSLGVLSKKKGKKFGLLLYFRLYGCGGLPQRLTEVGQVVD